MTTRDPQPNLELPDGTYHFREVLKADFFSVNELHDKDGRLFVLKKSRFRFLGGFLLYPLAILMSRREYQVYRRVADVEGVPALGPRVGLSGYFHEYIPGRTLKDVPRREQLRDDFFPRLRATVEEVHRRRIFYLDLAKSDNIIVSDDGLPYLIDFQVCIRFPQAETLPGRLTDPLFRFLKHEDIYHFCKHKRKRRKDQMTAKEWTCSRRTRFGWFWRRWIWQPYLSVKRRIYPHGSNEIIWWKWRQMQRAERDA
jgi:hypothetical protein